MREYKCNWCYEGDDNELESFTSGDKEEVINHVLDEHENVLRPLIEENFVEVVEER